MNLYLTSYELDKNGNVEHDKKTGEAHEFGYYELLMDASGRCYQVNYWMRLTTPCEGRSYADYPRGIYHNDFRIGKTAEELGEYGYC
jgi:hypothetical protein